ncbi:ABC transporter permease [Fumia xinanensis]|uniref:ABC transporter permease n=1 Tax=Fumia xinanensis TaxID=2763659 RepID=A0A926E246_9FIRM|nr:ABC transporter permease [Fumia xinanensis]MBC8558817.1 ABC transporter permease [Fumia xinanensis]
MSLSVIQGALELGLIFAIMSLGIFISFRILNIPDLTIDGTFTLGTSVSAIFAVNGHPVLGVILAMVAGGLAGCVTGFLQTKMKVQPILAGILTMTALYSVNLRVMGQKPNLSLFDKESIFSGLTQLMGEQYANLMMIALILIISLLAIYFFLKTQLGMSLRATGDNEDMVRASSINSDAMKIMGLAIANAFVALAGAILAQYQSFSDVSGGIGMMVIGLASIIVGEAVFGRKSILRSLLAVVVGAVIYRFVLTIALRIGLEAGDLKLFSAILVTIAICIPTLKGFIMKRRSRRAKN